ncbi:MAG: D-hexose-6-phosphate mutarotase [Ornithinimicrobium sp.]
MAAFTPRTLMAGEGVLTAYDHGAHVASWTINDVPVVWVSGRSQYVADAAIRGGVPICWPWFAGGPSGDRKPSHGLARTATWDLVEQDVDAARWRLTSAMLGKAGEDLDAEVACEMHVMVTSEALQLRHTVTNVGQNPMSYEVALHTYLHVGDVRHVEVVGLGDAAYYDKVKGQNAHQTVPLRITDEVDRIYHSPGPVHLVDPILDRQLSVRSEGASNTVIWNPGPAGAADMGDFGDTEWTHMLCVETANIDHHAISLEPGRSHTTTALITVSPSHSVEAAGTPDLDPKAR